MNSNLKKRLTRIALLSLAAFAIGGGIALVELGAQNAHVTQKSGQDIPMAGLQIKSRFELVDHNGTAVTQDTYKGKYTLIYFGFTYCPAICPTELRKISEALDQLPDNVSTQIQPLFITIDPERDTVPVMKDYVGLFHPALVGLTGTPAQIENTKAAFRVFARKVNDPDLSDYTMDHSSYIYFMDQNGALRSMYRIKDSADYIAQDIQKRI